MPAALGGKIEFHFGRDFTYVEVFQKAFGNRLERNIPQFAPGNKILGFPPCGINNTFIFVIEIELAVIKSWNGKRNVFHGGNILLIDPLNSEVFLLRMANYCRQGK